MGKKLESVTLVAIDGAGNRPLITKALNYSKRGFEFKEIILLSPTNNYENLENINLISIPSMTYEDWNRFTIKELYKYITTKHFIYIDTDGFIINPNIWKDTFLEYDYIGAPFYYPDHIMTHHVYDYVKNKSPEHINLVGNGGFTLRSTKLLETLQDCPDTKYNPEDVYICLNNYDFLIAKGIKFAPYDLASIFSQNVLRDTINIFGFHGDKNYINIINV